MKQPLPPNSFEARLDDTGNVVSWPSELIWLSGLSPERVLGKQANLLFCGIEQPWPSAPPFAGLVAFRPEDGAQKDAPPRGAYVTWLPADTGSLLVLSPLFGAAGQFSPEERWHSAYEAPAERTLAASDTAPQPNAFGDPPAPLGSQGDALSTAIADNLRGFSGDANTQRLATILGTIPGFSYLVDRDLVFTSSAGRGLLPLGLETDQLKGVSLTTLWGNSDPQYEPLRCHLKALAGLPATYQDVCQGRSLEYQLRPLRDESGQVAGVIGVGMDVTERESARESQRHLTAELRQAQKLEDIGRLAGGVAHDFNNLLTCIMGNLALAEVAAAEGGDARPFLEECNRAVDSAAGLTKHLLAFGRKRSLNPRLVDLSALVGNVEGILRRLIGENISLSTECAEDIGLVKVDPSQLEQVLVNLVVNARDAISGHGSITLRTENTQLEAGDPQRPAKLAPGSYVVLSVEDTGQGMSELVLRRLFEPFFTTKEQGEGTGLGLSTVYGAAEQNGGTVSVQSTIGQGSHFRVYLPRAEGSLESAVSSVDHSQSQVVTKSFSGGHETILLVEDEPIVMELAQATLEQLGYRVLACSGADSALRRFNEHDGPIHLLLTDVVMPRMSGKELAGRLCSFRPEIAVLFSSGYGEEVVAQKGETATRENFISKPYRPAELGQKVRDVLDDWAAQGFGDQTAISQISPAIAEPSSSKNSAQG